MPYRLLDKIPKLLHLSGSGTATLATLLLLGTWIVWMQLRKYFEANYCAVGDLRTAGDAVKERRKGCCLVVGASVTGILAARVAATHFERVVLLDAEAVTTDPTVKRTRVKQHSQLHLFLGLLYPALKVLFPTFEEEVVADQGSSSFIIPQPVSFLGIGFLKLPTLSSGWAVRQIYLSREYFEATLRRLLLATHGNVEQQVGTAQKLVVTQDRQSVTGVVVRRSDAQEETVECVMVVDASGTTNGSIGWLKRAGYPSPVKVTYDPAIVYSCFTFDLTPSTIKKYNALNGPYHWSDTGHIGACFSSSQVSVFMRQEGNRVRTMYQTFVGQGGEPDSVAALEASTACAPYEPWQQEAIKLLCRAEEDDGAPTPSHSKVNIGVCYRVDYNPHDMPTNLVPLGDTILRVNPIFGQGCTKAMVDILTLDNALRKFQSQPLSIQFLSHYLKLHTMRTNSFWNHTRWADYIHSGTKPVEGDNERTGAWWRSFRKWVIKAAVKDEKIGAIVTEITAQLRPVQNYFYPHFLLRCAWISLTSKA